MLAHAAEMQALRVVNHIVGKKDGIRFDIMPAAIFTEPEAACVGLSEDQLKEQGIDYVCKKSFWRANGKALAMNETQEVSVLMCRDTTLAQLRDMVHIHPTLSEVLKTAAEG